MNGAIVGSALAQERNRRTQAFGRISHVSFPGISTRHSVPSRIRRKLLKTNNPCTLYPSLERGGRELVFTANFDGLWSLKTEVRGYSAREATPERRPTERRTRSARARIRRGESLSAGIM